MCFKIKKSFLKKLNKVYMIARAIYDIQVPLSCLPSLMLPLVPIKKFSIGEEFLFNLINGKFHPGLSPGEYLRTSLNGLVTWATFLQNMQVSDEPMWNRPLAWTTSDESQTGHVCREGKTRALETWLSYLIKVC